MDIERVKKLCQVLRNETRPLEGHTDPWALQDCWNEIFKELNKPTTG